MAHIFGSTFQQLLRLPLEVVTMEGWLQSGIRVHGIARWQAGAATFIERLLCRKHFAEHMIDLLAQSFQ